VHATIPADITDTVQAVQVLIDEGNMQVEGDCTTGQVDDHTCDITIPTWDTTGYTTLGHNANGQHRLQVFFASARAQVILPTVAVDVENPPITVSLTGVTAGQALSGTVNLTATGTIPAALSSKAVSIEFTDPTGVIADVPCTGVDDHVCQVTYPWDVTHRAGYDQVSATFMYTGWSIHTDPVDVVFPVGTRTTVKVPAARTGTTVTGTGTVVSTAAVAQGLAGVHVTIVVKPVVGTTRTYQATTDASGRYSWTFPASTNATVTASVAAQSFLLASHASIAQPVTARLTCTWTKTLVHGHPASGTCKQPYLPLSTRYTLQRLSGRSWVAVTTGKSRSGSTVYSTLMRYRGSYSLRLVIAANRVWAATVSPTMLVKVT
jgi:hypothetical protein